MSQCRTCHSMEPKSTPTGPHFSGLNGRAAGSLDDFRYTTALSGSGITWDAETLDAFLESPRQYVPGTRMFNAVRDADERAAIIEYLTQ